MVIKQLKKYSELIQKQVKLRNFPAQIILFLIVLIYLYPHMYICTLAMSFLHKTKDNKTKNPIQYEK